MEYKNFSSKFALQTQTKYKNTKIQTRLQEPLPWDMPFESSAKKCLTAEIKKLEK